MSIPDIQIRAAKPEDAAGVAAVHIRSWQETYRGLMPDDYLDNLESSEGARRHSFWQKNLSAPEGQRATWVAQRNSETVGFISVGKCRDEAPISDGEIYAIYLLKAHHGLGIGRSLFEAGIRLLKEMGMKSASLWVAKGNKTEGFYSHLGGVKQGEKVGRCGGANALAETRFFWSELRVRERDSKPILNLREIEPEDADLINRYWAENTDDDLSRLGEFIYQLCVENIPPERAEEGIKIWMLNGNPIGYCSLKQIRYREDAQIHLHMWNRNVRGKGLGAVFFCLTALRFIQEFKLSALYCQPKSDNPMPNRMLKRIGFNVVGSVDWKNPGNGKSIRQNRYLIDRDIARTYLDSVKNDFAFSE